jgi:hypothetical protein
MIGPADLEEYFKMLEQMDVQTAGNYKFLLEEQQNLINEQMSLSKRMFALQMKILGVKQ